MTIFSFPFPSPMYKYLRWFFNKGGAGRYISREQSVARLAPLIEKHLELLQSYDTAIARGLPEGTSEKITAAMDRCRTELNKLYETVFSLGGTAPTGTALKPNGASVGEDPVERLHTILRLENAYCDAVKKEIDAVHHQERTRGILKAVAQGSNQRLELLRELTVPYPRTVATS